VTTVVIDASIAIKWVVEEDGTAEALTLRRRANVTAPELLIAECANILWKKVQRGELNSDEALLAARLLQAAEIEFLPSRSLLEAATQIAIELKHAAYDCLYLALAAERDCRFVTADESFVRKLRERHRRQFRGRVIGLAEVARELSRPRSAGP
jgi:predicted nucleic acid-binding protein